MNALSLIMMLLQGAGLTPERIKALAADEAHALAKQQLARIMNAAVPAVASKAQAEGWTVGNVKGTTANKTPHALSEHEVVRDWVFRLWRHVYAFHGGGHLADAFRDREEMKVGAAVEPGWDGSAATYADAVQKTADAIVALVF